MASNLDPKDAEAGVRAVECDTFDQTGQGFAILGGDVGAHVSRDAFTPVTMPCCPGERSSAPHEDGSPRTRPGSVALLVPAGNGWEPSLHGGSRQQRRSPGDGVWYEKMAEAGESPTRKR